MVFPGHWRIDELFLPQRDLSFEVRYFSVISRDAGWDVRLGAPVRYLSDGGISTLPAFALPISIIGRATARFIGLCAAAFLPEFAVGHKHDLRQQKLQLWITVFGSVDWFCWTAFFHEVEAKQLLLLLPCPFQ